MRLTTTTELLALLPRNLHPDAWAAAFASSEVVNDPLAGFALINYLVLTEWSGSSSLDLSTAELFWNRVYWFQVFVLLRESRTGSDAGLRQQAFAILEQPDDNTDWSTLEIVHSYARKAVDAILAADPI